MGKLITCPHCKKMVDGDLQYCTYCKLELYDVSWLDNLNENDYINDKYIIKKSPEEEKLTDEEKINDLLDIKDKNISKPKMSKKTILILSLSILVVVAAVIFIIIFVGKNNAKDFYAKNFSKFYYSKTHIYQDMAANGFSNSQIEYAIEKCNVDFNRNAINYLYLLTTSETFPHKTEMINFLNLEGFAEQEINYAMDCYDHDKFLQDFCNNLLNSYNETNDKLLSKNKILDKFKKCGMSTEDINLAKTKLSWNNLSYECLRDYLNNTSPNKNESIEYLKKSGYTNNEVSYAVEKTKWVDYAQKCIEKYILENDNNKKDILEYLSTCGYSDEIIKTAIDEFDWNTCALNYAKEYIDKSEEAVSRLDVYTSLKDNSFTDEEIAFALSNIKFNEICLKYLTKLVENDTNADVFKCIDKNYLVDSLNKAGFEKADILNAVASISWQDCANKSADKLIEYAQKNNYDFSSYNKTSIKNLLSSAGYSFSEITNALDLVDWPEIATKYIKNSIENKNYDKKSLQYKITSSGLSSEDIDKVLNSIDWKDACLEYAKSLNSDYKETKQKLYNYSYSDSEIDYALNNINWKDRALNYAKSNSNLSRLSLSNLLKQHDFTDDQITYAIDNSGIDFKENCYNELLTYGTYEEIIDSENNLKNDIRQNLIVNKYTNDEIEYAFNKISGQ